MVKTRADRLESILNDSIERLDDWLLSGKTLPVRIQRRRRPNSLRYAAPPTLSRQEWFGIHRDLPGGRRVRLRRRRWDSGIGVGGCTRSDFSAPGVSARASGDTEATKGEVAGKVPALRTGILGTESGNGSRARLLRFRCKAADLLPTKTCHG